MKKYSIFRKTTITVLCAILFTCLSMFVALTVSNAKLVKAEQEPITVNGQEIDISSFKTYPLASVRTEEINPGIRFVTGIDEEIYSSLIEAIDGTDWSIKFGTIITYKSRVDAVSDFTKAELDKLSVSNGSLYADCEAVNFTSTSLVSGNKEFTAVLKINERNYQKELTARGYMVVSDGTNEQIYYADYEDFSRNVTDVAKTSVENIASLQNTTQLETLNEYAVVGEDGYNMVKSSNDVENSGLIKAGEGASSISVADFGNKKDVYAFSQTNSTNAWEGRLEPAIISPSLSWADAGTGSENALARQKALGLKYFRFDFFNEYSRLGAMNFSLYYPTSSGEHGIVNFNDLTVSSSSDNWDTFVKVYDALGNQTTTLEYSKWYTVIVDISCNLAMDSNENPQVAIVHNGTNNQSINPQCFDNVIFYRELNSALNMPINVTNNNGTFSWDAVDGATSYNVKVNQYAKGVLTTANYVVDTNSINLSSYGECEVSVQAVNAIDETSSYSAISTNRTNVIYDFNAAQDGIIASTTTASGYTSSTVNSVTYNNDGTVEIDVKSAYKQQNFNVTPTDLQMSEDVTGIAIRFKVVSSGYAAGTTLYFKYVGKLANHGYGDANANNGVVVTVGEWQTLVVNKDVIEEYKRLSSDDFYRFYFMIYSTTGNSNAVATILLDDISYVEKIKTPTNLNFTDGVLTWNAVNGATSYNVQVNQYYNGTVTTTNLTSNTNSIDLTAYGKCEVSVQAINTEETSSYSAIVSNRTNVIYDFNAEQDGIIASTTTANGYTGSTVNSVTYNNDGTVEIKVKSSYNNQNFNIIPATTNLDFKDGIIIRFKVVSSGYASASALRLQYIGAGATGYGNANNYGVDVTVGEWQTLKLTKEQIVASGYYVADSTNAWKLHFTLLATLGNNGNAVATILLDEISYIEKPEAPTNLAFTDGILTWNAVNGATSYNVKVNQYANGVVTTTNLVANTNSIDLTSYGECEVSVQTVDGEDTSSYSAIRSNRTNVIYDFNDEKDNVIVDSNITSYTASVVNSTTHNDDGTVTAVVQSNGWKHTNFKVNLDSACDLTTNGISIRFKVESTNYTSGTLSLMLVDNNATHYGTTQNHIEVTVGEWQTLTLTNEELSSWLKKEWSSLFFCVQSSAGQSNTTVTVTLDDISYITAE